MRRDELRHLVRAACRATGEHQVIVMGSQAILGSWKEIAAPERATMSNEADLAFFDDPDEFKADTVMGVLGMDSQFHQTYDIYADGIASDTATLPSGWKDRLITLISHDRDEVFIGWCLDPHDLCGAKMAAGRPKDHDFVEVLVRAEMVDPVAISEHLGAMGLPAERTELAVGLLARWTVPGWNEQRRQTLHARRTSARRDLLAQCPVPGPPCVEYPLRCNVVDNGRPCRELRSHCKRHPI